MPTEEPLFALGDFQPPPQSAEEAIRQAVNDVADLLKKRRHIDSLINARLKAARERGLNPQLVRTTARIQNSHYGPAGYVVQNKTLFGYLKAANPQKSLFDPVPPAELSEEGTTADVPPLDPGPAPDSIPET